MAEHPEQVPALHRAASDWYAAHHLVADAVRHALAAGDDDRAGYLMESALPEMRRNRQDSVLLRWMRSLPDPVVRRSPVLSIMSAWSLMMAGDLDGMELRLDDADAALAAGAHDRALAATWADTEDLRTAPATVWVYRAALAQARGDVRATVRHARQALDLAGADDHFVRGARPGSSAWPPGRPVTSRPRWSTFSDAVRSLHAAGNLSTSWTARWCSATCGSPRAVPTGPGSSTNVPWRRRPGTASPTRGPPPTCTWDWPRWTASWTTSPARRTPRDRRVLGERGSITENRHRWYVAMAQVRTATGDYATARRLLDEAEALYRPGSYPDIRPIPAMQARVHIAGETSTPRSGGQTRRRAPADAVTFLREYEHLTLVRLLLARHHRDPRRWRPALPDEVALLDRLHADAEPTRAGSLLEIGMLRALTHHARGDRPRRSSSWPGAGPGAGAGQLHTLVPRRRRTDARPAEDAAVRDGRRVRPAARARPPPPRRRPVVPAPTDRRGRGRAGRPAQRTRARGPAAPRRRPDRARDRPASYSSP